MWIILLFLIGCTSTPPCSPQFPHHVSLDKFAYWENGQAKYIIQNREYSGCSTNVLNQWDVTREEWEKQ